MKPFEIALKEYGVKGILGTVNNPAILGYFKAIGHAWVKDDETAWCAAFVNWCLWKSELPDTGKLDARSFLTYGQPTKSPEIGDLVVLWRIYKDGPYGHVGFFIKETDKTVFILGGNQSNSVNITEFSKEFLLEYRKVPLVYTNMS